MPDQPEKEIWGGEEVKEGRRSSGQSSINEVCRRKLLNTWWHSESHNIKNIASSSRKWRDIAVTRTQLLICFCFAVLLGVITRNCWWLLPQMTFSHLLIIFCIGQKQPMSWVPLSGVTSQSIHFVNLCHLPYEICTLSSHFKWDTQNLKAPNKIWLVNWVL